MSAYIPPQPPQSPEEWAEERLRGAREPPRVNGEDHGPGPEPPPHPETEPAPNPFSLLRFIDIKPVLDAQDFVQGLLVANSITVVYGQWGTGKTFWVTTLALHIAAGYPFAGRRVDQGGVVYSIMESGVGFHNRVATWAEANGLGAHDLPFIAIPEHLNLLDPNANLDAFIAAVHQAKRDMAVPLRLIVIDTLARAMSGGNENDPEDMGALVMNANRLRVETGAAVLFVHHSGKDQTKGARGHSSLSAAIDTEIEITHDEDDRAATVLKQRDIDKGQTMPFALKVVEIGHNQHGELITSCLVEFFDVPQNVPLRPRLSLKGHQKRAFEILTDMVARSGQSGFPGAPPDVLSIPELWWRDNFYDRAMAGAEPEAKRKAFRRAADALVEFRVVGMANKRVWITARATD